MTTRASARQENCSTSSSSSRTRPLKDSTDGFCHGAPGSMNAVSALRPFLVFELGRVHRALARNAGDTSLCVARRLALDAPGAAEEYSASMSTWVRRWLGTGILCAVL